MAAGDEQVEECPEEADDTDDAEAAEAAATGELTEDPAVGVEGGVWAMAAESRRAGRTATKE